jgi:hypothetical protein
MDLLEQKTVVFGRSLSDRNQTDLEMKQAHSCGGHFIRDDPAGFDAPLFSITAKEAAGMDPVQRWTLEVSYRAFENGQSELLWMNNSFFRVLTVY